MIKFTNRRAISSIIGGAVFLVLFISAFTVFIFAIEVTSDRFSEQLSTSFEDSIRNKESFKIAPTIDTSQPDVPIPQKTSQPDVPIPQKNFTTR